MYCPECETDPCRFFPDEAREQKASTSSLLRLYTHALLLGLDSTELEDEKEGEEDKQA